MKPDERERLLDFGKDFRRAVKELIAIASPKTLFRWMGERRPKEIRLASKLMSVLLTTVSLLVSCSRQKVEPSHGEDVSEKLELVTSSIDFRDEADERGLNFLITVDDPGRYRFPDIMGPGCATFDANGDTRLDLLLLRHSPHASQSACSLYIQDEHGQFVDLANASGLDEVSNPFGVAVGDANNDGLPDIYFSSTENDQLFINQGGGVFRDETTSSGMANSAWGTSCCWVDYDRDGWLDLFVTNYVYDEDRTCIRLSGGDRDFCGPHLFSSVSDKLFRNVTSSSSDGRVRFVDVSTSAGIASRPGAGLGIVAVDFTGDGWVDFYVANDQQQNFLWVNQQNGTFREEALVRGCGVNHVGKPQASMGIGLGDLNGDLQMDLILTHLDFETHAVYQNSKGGFFRDVSHPVGVAERSRPFTGFGVAWEDFDNDGDQDLFVTNGRVKRLDSQNENLSEFWNPYRQPDQLFEWRSRQFVEVDTSSAPWNTPSVGRGLARGDIDRDGDVDLLVTGIGQPRLLLNTAPASNHWLSLRCVDPKHENRDAIGARVIVRQSASESIRWLITSDSYLSSQAAEAHFGLGDNGESVTAKILWPDGAIEEECFHIEHVDQLQVLVRGQGEVK